MWMCDNGIVIMIIFFKETFFMMYIKCMYWGICGQNDIFSIALKNTVEVSG